MKKVLHISNYYYPHIGGIEQVARDCVNALKGDSEQRVFCFNHEKGDSCDIVDGVQIIRAGCFAKVASQSLSLSCKKLLKNLFKEFAPDIVVFHFPNPFVAHYLLKILKKNGASLTVYYHLDITKQKILGKFFKGQTKRLIARAAQVVATSPVYASDSPVLKTCPEKVRAVPLSVDPKRLEVTEKDVAAAEEIRQSCGGKTILFAVGRHVPYKGMEYLIRASKLLGDGFKVFIGGKGPLTDNLKELAAGDEKIEFCGVLDDDGLKAHYLACDIFCFPSITKNEAFGIALAEAMSFGKPAVTFTVAGSGINYVSVNGVTGIEAPNCDYAAFADGIKTLAADVDMRKKYGEAAKARAEELFSREKYNCNIRALFEKRDFLSKEGNEEL